MSSQNIKKSKLQFANSQGLKLSGQWMEAKGSAMSCAIFASCFTCSKNTKATQWISQSLASLGISVFTFDFRGLGESEGDFAETTLETMREDYGAAVSAMRQHFRAPQLLIGHSIGGVIAMQMASRIPEAKAVVTLATPASFQEVLGRLAKQLPELEAQHTGFIHWGGQRFPVRKSLIESLQQADILKSVSALKLPLLVVHSIRDEILSFQNGIDLFEAAANGKSFVGLRAADHLFLDRLDARYVATVIRQWASSYGHL